MHSTSLFSVVVALCGLLADALPWRSVAPEIRPLVIWHGLGDTAHSKGIMEFIEAIKEVKPGIFVHSISVMDKEEDDKKAGFFGDIELQLQNVSLQLNGIPELKYGFDAMGFSQGGQFLRAYQEIYAKPPINNLITFGSQHMGISELPVCGTWDFLCHLMHRYARGQVYSDWSQRNLIPAQYFRDSANLPTYYEKNKFLPYINNELPEARNSSYVKHLTSLENLVMVLFSNDTTVVPKESGWFGSYSPPIEDSKGEDLPIIPMREHPVYIEDWIGLKELDERGSIVEIVCEGPHMHISSECWIPLVEKYTGGEMGVKGAEEGLVIQLDRA